MRARASLVLALLLVAPLAARPGRAALHVGLPAGGVRRAPGEGLRRDREGRGRPRPGRARARGLPPLPPVERLLLPVRGRGAARVPAPRRREPPRDALPAPPEREARAVGREAALGGGRRARDEALRGRGGGRDGPARRDTRPPWPDGGDEGRLRPPPAGRGPLGEPRRRAARGGGDGQRPVRRPALAGGRPRPAPARPLPLARDPQPHARARRGAPREEPAGDRAHQAGDAPRVPLDPRGHALDRARGPRARARRRLALRLLPPRRAGRGLLLARRQRRERLVPPLLLGQAEDAGRRDGAHGPRSGRRLLHERHHPHVAGERALLGRAAGALRLLPRRRTRPS